MINFIHPYPAVKPSNQLGIANRSGTVSSQVAYSIQEMDRQTAIHKNPAIMEDIEQFPNPIKYDHNEIARRLLDKIS